MTLQPAQGPVERRRRWDKIGLAKICLVQMGLMAAGLVTASSWVDALAVGLEVPRSGAIAGPTSVSRAGPKAEPKVEPDSAAPEDGPPPTDEAAPLRPITTCPDDFGQMTQAMLQDLPDYANRVLARSRTTLAADVQTHIALSGPATYAEAIPGPRWDGPTASKLDENGVQQVFFTTLERQYVGEDLTSLQHYHWALIARTDRGWQLAGLFSRLAGYPADQPPSPFLETTYGDVGQAIDLWLRDCEAGAIEGS